MSFGSEFKQAVAKIIGHPDAKILDWEEYTEYGGYCDTCAYEETHVRVKYELPGDNEVLLYDYYGSFSELLDQLLRAND